MGLIKALLLPKSEKLQFVEGFSSFSTTTKKNKEKSKFKIYSGSSLTL